MQANKQFNVLISLDCLFDTRLSSVALVNQEWGEKLIDSPYRSRLEDKFSVFVPEIDDAAVMAQYKERDWTALYAAEPTMLMFDFVQMTESIIRSLDNINAEGFRHEVHLNIWPYDLRPNEKKDYIDAFRSVSGTPFPIHIVSLPTDQLTLSLMKMNSYGLVFLYDWDDWHNCLARSTAEQMPQMPGLSVVVPQTSLGLDKLVKMFHELQERGDKTDPYQYITQYYAEFVRIVFRGTEYFSHFDLRNFLQEQK